MKVEDLKLDGQNARKRSDRATGQLAKSLEEFGAARSVVMDADGVIRAGNGTVVAAKAAGINKVKVVKGKPDELVVVQRSDLSGERAAAYAIADNRTSELAEWDTDRLGDQLAGFNDFTAADLGFEDTDLAELFPVGEQEVEDIEPQLDRAEELQKEWGTESGQLWAIGEHRLLCGDATSEVDVERLMDGDYYDLIFTDPPYNCAEGMSESFYQGCNSPAMKELSSIEWDKGFNIESWLSILEPPKDGTVYVCTSHTLAPAIWEWMKSTHSSCDGYCAWTKPNPMPSMAKRHPTWATELICYATYGKHVFNFPKEGHEFNWWNIASTAKADGHPTQKPVQVPAKAIGLSSDTGDSVYDPFLGSGTTMLAAEQLGRRCFGMEISPKYCAVILERMKTAGCEPKRGKDGS